MSLIRAQSPSSTATGELLATLATGIHSVYQPIVRLADRRVIAHEALARGPVGSHLERPDALFAMAREEGLEGALDWECWRAALRGGLEGGLGPDRALFVNVDPASATSWVPDIDDPLLGDALRRFPVVVELTKRELPDHTNLIPLAEDLRRRGARIALGGVGTDPHSLALMPFLRPDVIKLDLKLMHDSPSREIAETAHAVAAEAERTGALILAEGIETEEHLRRALALGASYGQGWLYGRPGGLRSGRRPGRGDDIFPARRNAAKVLPRERTPFEIVAAKRPLRRADKSLLLELSRSLESRTGNQSSSTVVMGAFQDERYFTPATARRYAELATESALVAVLGVGIDREPAPGVRGVHLDADEALCGEWDVIVLGPHYGAAFVARDLGDELPDGERRFDFALTHDRDLVTEAARAMMRQLAA